jgi:Dynamin family
MSEALPSMASLEALPGTEQRKIMDLADRLRRAGLSSILKLPQLVVCGDQSSGKSSVLEAITEIPFPRKDNLCTLLSGRRLSLVEKWCFLAGGFCDHYLLPCCSLLSLLEAPAVLAERERSLLGSFPGQVSYLQEGGR